MKKIVPFTKEIDFKTMVSSITSISLEHTLKTEDDNYIKGHFIISGTYKMTAASQIDEEFSYKIPVEIQVDSKYDVSNISTVIDDFTYEILNEDTLKVNISLCIDNLEEKQKRFDDEDLFLETTEEQSLEIPLSDKEVETKEMDLSSEKNNTSSEVVSSLFASFKDNAETFKTYSVYIVKEEDSIDSILLKYGIDKDLFQEYNDISDIKAGNKVIIPCSNNKNE